MSRKSTKSQARHIINTLNLLIIWRAFAQETGNTLKADNYDNRIESLLTDAKLFGLELFTSEETGMYNLKEDSKSLSLPSLSDVVFEKINTILTEKIDATNLLILRLEQDITAINSKTKTAQLAEALTGEKIRLSTYEEIKRDVILLFYPQN